MIYSTTADLMNAYVLNPYFWRSNDGKKFIAYLCLFVAFLLMLYVAWYIVTVGNNPR